jgi:hypothetical protein
LLLGGYFGYRLSREMYGESAGLVFLTLWCFSPLLLAWGGTVCPDAVAAALGITALYTLRQWLHRPNWTRAAIAGVCLGLLPLAKLTWIIAFGIWPFLWSVGSSLAIYPPVALDKERIDKETDTTSGGPLPGWHAVSVSEIFGRSQQYRYFLYFKPVATAGYAI